MSSASNPKTCPNCGETLKPHWKLCPSCGFSPAALLCPQCRSPVEDRWKLCPECQAMLLCPDCGKRIPAGQSNCPECSTAESQSSEQPELLSDPVTGMEFLRVPGGKFFMGDTFGEGIENELPVHEARLKTFYLGRFPVIQSQWDRLMPQNPSNFRGDRLPVEQVTWDDVQAFIRKLTEANSGSQAFRLPTEAEWEYAARSGGRKQRYAGGDDADAFAWFENNSGGQTRPVGSKAANALGIYDMSGNVWEWCQDRYSESAYQYHALEDSRWDRGREDRVIRGGSWNLDVWSVRCTRRMGYPSDFSGPALGFRLVMEP